jgi:hypothetical protein
MVRSDFEAGYVQSRPIATRGRAQFMVPYKNMPEWEYQVLKTFASSAIGETFPFPHPVTTVGTITCRFTDGVIYSTIVAPGFRDASFGLEEA